MITINGEAMSSTPIDVTRDVWRHICLSYQSDFGAWALYIDAKLAACESVHGVSSIHFLIYGYKYRRLKISISFIK